MNTAAKIAFKNNLKQFCVNTIEQRIATAKSAINDAQEAANSEEKSSAGDKYETGRAMGHLQKDMHARQLSEYIKELSALNKIDANTICSAATAGAFIETNQTSFFIIAGLGKQIIDSKTILFLSPNAPLAISLRNKKQGDDFVFNGTTIIISEVF